MVERCADYGHEEMIHGTKLAAAVAADLVTESVAFTLDPFPHDGYRFSFGPEWARLFRAIVGDRQDGEITHGSDSGGDDPVYRKQMTDAGRGALLR